ncbi:hypothetical protein IID62_05935 [candidate division KSB1 bacterium]|nr:hypothetical protein [candidate division KSB1 bacterium]
MNHQKGEALNVGFDESVKLEFNGAKVTSECNDKKKKWRRVSELSVF